ncbi:plasmid mobilization relaxosome protein MobC [Flavobacteriaceae bacterium F89]|uniref:Plasmid mobilization relaxosome protein MobC n=1 Tax=Cerina litoralis TaxID=2874477 RepID=A0AAE3EYT3_9FLAO|nr:plasmid mobilization relaxosome protein MobC [Cerina litoralis]MCG2462669.1 plasmid mobilization relaxosome protein MobC [Cerina litoralis]
MEKHKGGRKRLGNRKRDHAITLRFNTAELEKVRAILRSYNLDLGKRGTVGPFLRKLVLNRETIKEKQIPDGISSLSYQLNRIGTNINQLVKVAHYKNMRSPNANLEREIEKSNELMLELIETINAENYNDR